MLSKRRCPHTGVVNFYFDTDPHLAVGSVVVRKGAKIFWSCHTEPFERSGVAADLKSAERAVADLCMRAARHDAAQQPAAA